MGIYWMINLWKSSVAKTCLPLKNLECHCSDFRLHKVTRCQGDKAMSSDSGDATQSENIRLIETHFGFANPVDSLTASNQDRSMGTTEDEQPSTSGSTSNLNYMATLYDKLDTEFNQFNTIVKQYQIFDGPLSKRMVDLGRKLEAYKPILYSLGEIISKAEPQKRQKIWDQIFRAAKVAGLMSNEAQKYANYDSLTLVQFNVLGTRKIESLELKFDYLNMLKVQAKYMLNLNPNLEAGASTSSQTNILGDKASFFKFYPIANNKVMVMGDIFPDLVGYLRNNTAFRIWYLPNISMKTMEMIVRQEPKEIQANLDEIFLFVLCPKVCSNWKMTDVLNDLRNLLLAIKGVYGRRIKMAMCRWPGPVNLNNLANHVCHRVGARSIKVYPDFSMPTQIMVQYIADSIIKAQREGCHHPEYLK